MVDKFDEATRHNQQQGNLYNEDDGLTMTTTTKLAILTENPALKALS